MALRDILAVLDIEVNDKDLDEANKKLNGGIELLKNWGAAAATGGAVVAAAFVAVAGAALFAIKETANAVDELQDSADALGVAIEDLQAYSYAADRAGVSTMDFEASLRKITETQAQSGDAASGQAKAYKSLGIELKDANGEAKTSADIFSELHAAYQTGDAKKQAEVQKLLGGTFAKNLPIFNKTTEEFDALAAQGASLGIATQKQSDIAGQLNDTWDDVGRSLKSFGLILLQVLGPAVIQIGERFLGFIGIFKNLLNEVGDDKSLDDWAYNAQVFIDRAYLAFLEFVNGFLKQLIILKNTASSIWEDLKAFADKYRFALEVLVTFIEIKVVLALASWAAALVPVAVGWLAVNAAQLLVIATNPATWIIAGIALIGVALFKLWQNWDKIWGWIKQAAQDVADWFTNLWDAAINKVKGFFSGLPEFVQNILAKAFESTPLGQVIDLVKAAKGAFGGGEDAPKATAGDRAASVVNSGNTNTTTTTVGAINVNGAGDPGAVASKVAEKIQTGGNAATMNALSTNKRL